MSFCPVNFLSGEIFRRKPEKPDEEKFIGTYKKSASLCCIYLNGSSSLYSFIVLCLGSVWYMCKFRGLCMYVFCTVSYVNSAMLVKLSFGRIFFARNVKAFSGYLRKPKNIAMYTIFNVNVCMYRRTEGSTNQAYSTCIQFRISWILSIEPVETRWNCVEKKIFPSIFMPIWSRSNLNKFVWLTP